MISYQPKGYQGGGGVRHAILAPKHEREPVKHLGSEELPWLFDDALLGVAGKAAVVLD